MYCMQSPRKLGGPAFLAQAWREGREGKGPGQFGAGKDSEEAES